MTHYHKKTNENPIFEKLLRECKEIAGETVWAISFGINESREKQWEVYCSAPKFIKKLPKTYNGNKVHVILAPRPEAIPQEKNKQNGNKVN